MLQVTFLQIEDSCVFTKFFRDCGDVEHDSVLNLIEKVARPTASISTYNPNCLSSLFA